MPALLTRQSWDNKQRNVYIFLHRDCILILLFNHLPIEKEKWNFIHLHFRNIYLQGKGILVTVPP